MANNVFANCREIACKAGDGKVIAAFPDVCFTPPDKVPPTPPGVPVPYPLTSMASDTDKGTKKVVISNKPVMKRDASNFKKCNGDNAAQTAKKGLINSKLTGKVQFTSWSMDVKIEGKNVVRHLDLTTSNHASMPANCPSPFPEIDTQTVPAMTPEQEIKCAIQKCDKQNYDISKTRKGKAMPKGSRCAALGSKKHKCVENKLKGKTASGIFPEQPYPKGSVPGLARNRRPDVVVYPPGKTPPTPPCDVYDAIFPCAGATKTAKTKNLVGCLPSAPIPGSATPKAQPTSKESRCYKKIAGKGSVTPLSPEDCKKEKCP